MQPVARMVQLLCTLYWLAQRLVHSREPKLWLSVSKLSMHIPAGFLPCVRLALHSQPANNTAAMLGRKGSASQAAHTTRISLTPSRSVACRCQQQQQGRRDVLFGLTTLGLAVTWAGPSYAEESVTVATDTARSVVGDTPVAAAPSAAPAPAVSPTTPQPILFDDDEYTLLPPPTFDYIEIPFKRVERGPTPERSPVRCRFQATSPAGTAGLTVVVRNAQQISFSLLQVNDVSVYGNAQDAAKLLVPAGSTLLTATSQVVELPARETPIGTLDIPPKSYYYYEYLTKAGERIFMSAAASRGKVIVCGGAAPQAAWPQFQDALAQAVLSFRVK